MKENEKPPEQMEKKGPEGEGIYIRRRHLRQASEGSDLLRRVGMREPLFGALLDCMEPFAFYDAGFSCSEDMTKKNKKNEKKRFEGKGSSCRRRRRLRGKRLWWNSWCGWVATTFELLGWAWEAPKEGGSAPPPPTFAFVGNPPPCCAVKVFSGTITCASGAGGAVRVLAWCQAVYTRLQKQSYYLVLRFVRVFVVTDFAHRTTLHQRRASPPSSIPQEKQKTRSIV